MTDDLAGDITIKVSDQHADFRNDQVVALVEQTLQPTVRYAAWVPVSRNLLEDSAAFNGVIEHAMDRWLRPWKFADRNPLPAVDLFPFVSSLQRRARELRALPQTVRVRLIDAWHVLRHGLPDEDDW